MTAEGDVPDLERLLDELGNAQIRAVLVGGLAARLRGASVVTDDVDVVYARDPENLQRLAAWITASNVRFLSRPDLTPLMSHLESPGHKLTRTQWGRLDLLGTAGAGRGYDDVAIGAEPLDDATPTILVASLDMIITLKEEAGREKDVAVLPLLRSVRSQLAQRDD